MKKLLSSIFFALFLLSLGQITHAEETRVGGKDRFEVAVNISKENWPNGANTVFITNYLAFADALSAAPLAFQNDSPVLLSHPDHLTTETKQEIIRLKPKNVVLIGGASSLTTQVVMDLQSLGIQNTSRIDGKDRFEVSANIAMKMPKSQTVVVTNGLVFADALSIASYAANNRIPILLTAKDKLPDSISKVAKDEVVSQSLIIGGPGSVSESVQGQLRNPQRIGGADRYEVAANIANSFFPAPEKAYLATGLNFADALTGSVAAAKQKAPILLTKSDEVPEDIQTYLITKQLNKITILGGTGSVKDGIYYFPGNWNISKPAKSELQGYTAKTSYLPGDLVQLYIRSNKNYNMEIYRMGYYDQKGAELKVSYGKFKANRQAAAINASTMAANWDKTVHFGIPNNWDSGMYMIKLISSDLKESYIPFVVKSASPNPNGMGLVISTNTYQAYNNWGGKSLYDYGSSQKTASVKVSFDRPYNEDNGSGQFFQYEYNMIRWLEKKGYKLSYFTDQDIDQGFLETSGIKTLIIPGHDEYWTMKTRDSIENLSRKNLNLGVFNANIGCWQARFEDNYRTLVSYKDKANLDPYNQINAALVTTYFRLPPVNRPEDQVYGILYNGIPDKTMPMIVTNADHWLYQGTGLKNEDQILGVVGGEVDRYGGGIPNVEVIAHSLVTFHGVYSSSDVVWYQKPEGGKVFAVGTFNWNWFLEPYGHEGKAVYNPAIEQITQNALNKLME